MRIEIRVKPNRKVASITADLFGSLIVAVREPPVDGQANAAVIAALAGYYDVPKSAITILRGHKNKIKLIEIKNLQLMKSRGRFRGVR